MIGSIGGAGLLLGALYILILLAVAVLVIWALILSIRALTVYLREHADRPKTPGGSGAP